MKDCYERQTDDRRSYRTQRQREPEPSELRRLLARRAEGVPLREIARVHGLSMRQVQAILRDQGEA